MQLSLYRYSEFSATNRIWVAALTFVFEIEIDQLLTDLSINILMLIDKNFDKSINL